jgi:cellobiose phosphorylase
MKNFINPYGHFSADGREYIITNPNTPRPWGNVISNGDFGMMISQNGSGYCWRGNAGQNRITRSFQDLIKDNWGQYFYIRDLDTHKFWSTSLKPVMSKSKVYEVAHGLGYSRFTREINGILSEMTVLVSVKDPVQIFSIKLTNVTNSVKNLDLSSYSEWSLGFAPDEHREFHKLFIETAVDLKNQAVTARKCLWGFGDEKGRHNNTSWPYTAWMASSEPLKSYDCDKESFLGMYRNDNEPLAMEMPKLAQRSGRFGDAIAALQVDVKLEPNASKTIVFTCGIAEDDKENHLDYIKQYTNEIAAQSAMKEVDQFWRRFVDTEVVETPDDALNLMTNIWLKYQSISCRLWGKSAFYQVSAGYGYRDQLQDSQIFLVSEPEYTKKQILMHAEKQFIEGDVEHWWFTIKGWRPRGNCSDDLLWLPFILDAYLKETGDFSILDEKVAYLNGPAESLYQHCKRAIEKVFTRFSPRGIPLMGDHDWNDGLSAVGTDMKGESFWVAEFLYLILENFIPLSVERDDIVFSEKCQDVHKNLRVAMNQYGWDGNWFLQATTDDGLLLGSKTNTEGKIFLMPNNWAVISGIAEEKRLKEAMKNVSEYLLKDYGTLLNYPAFTSPRTDIGYVTRYAPGLRENGGVYTHAATWSVWAYSLLGQSEKAYEAYRKICPPNRSKDIDVYKAEPYVTPGNIDGPLSEYYGRGGWSWYTGSSQWLHRVGTQWILGVRPEFNGLRIEPSIPKKWDHYKVKRVFRNATYDITVNNPRHKNSGVSSVVIDGKAFEGTLLPIFADHKTHTIVVTL